MDIKDFFFDLTKKMGLRKNYAGILCLDRDGVIIKEVNYLRNPDDIEFIEGSIQALKEIIENNYFVAVISNQAGIAKGIITMDDFHSVNNKFMAILKDNNVFLNCIIYCPFYQKDNFNKISDMTVYRKPMPGMFNFIRNYYKFTNDNIFMIGDKLIDIEFGKNIGAKSIIVDTGYGIVQKIEVFKKYNDVLSVKDLQEGIKLILRNLS